MKLRLLTKNWKKIGGGIVLILLAFSLPILLMSMLSSIVKFGTVKINSSEIIIDFLKPIEIGNYLNYYFTILGIEVTGVLTYSVLQTSKQSNILTKEINDKEKNRDKEKIRESALIIYYDIISKIRNLIVLYNSKEFNVNTEIINGFNASSDWVKNIANLRDVLTAYELETIFNLYNNFLLLTEFQHTQGDKSEEMNSIVNNLSNKLFITPLLNYLWMDFNGMTELLLSSKYYIILKKILSVTQNKENRTIDFLQHNNKKIKYNNCEFDDYGNIIKGVDKCYTSNNNLLYEFEYNDRKIVKGIFYNKHRELIFNCTFNLNTSYSEGYVTYYYKPNRLKYKGNIKNGKYAGTGIVYYDSNANSIEFSGIWENNKKKNGEYKSNSNNASILYFNGEYKNDMPYSGKIECHYTFKLRSSDVYGFNGTIFQGKPVDGGGYKVSKSYFTSEFIEKNPKYDTSLNYYPEYSEDYEEYLNNIPVEVQQEMIESSLRNEKEIELEDLKERYGCVIELLSATWNDGICETAEEDILNKEFFAMN